MIASRLLTAVAVLLLPPTKTLRDSQQRIFPIGFLFLKLPPPPRAALLVYTVYIYIHIYIEIKYKKTYQKIPGLAKTLVTVDNDPSLGCLNPL